MDLVLSVSDDPFNKTNFELFMSRTIDANVTVTSYTDKLSQRGGAAESVSTYLDNGVGF